MWPRYAHVLCAAFSSCGMFMATGCKDHRVRYTFEFCKSNHSQTYSVFLLCRIHSVFGPKGLEHILDRKAHSNRVSSIQWANTGLRFVSGSDDGTAIIWRYEEQEWRTVCLRMTCQLKGTATAEEPSQKFKVKMVRWNRDDRWVIAAVSDCSIQIWDSTTGKFR